MRHFYALSLFAASSAFADSKIECNLGGCLSSGWTETRPDGSRTEVTCRLRDCLRFGSESRDYPPPGEGRSGGGGGSYSPPAPPPPPNWTFDPRSEDRLG